MQSQFTVRSLCLSAHRRRSEINILGQGQGQGRGQGHARRTLVAEEPRVRGCVATNTSRVSVCTARQRAVLMYGIRHVCAMPWRDGSDTHGSSWGTRPTVTKHRLGAPGSVFWTHSNAQLPQHRRAGEQRVAKRGDGPSNCARTRRGQFEHLHVGHMMEMKR